MHDQSRSDGRNGSKEDQGKTCQETTGTHIHLRFWWRLVFLFWAGWTASFILLLCNVIIDLLILGRHGFIGLDGLWALSCCGFGRHSAGFGFTHNESTHSYTGPLFDERKCLQGFSALVRGVAGKMTHRVGEQMVEKRWAGFCAHRSDRIAKHSFRNVCCPSG